MIRQRTRRHTLIGVNLLEEGDCVVKHVGSPGELILGLGDLLDGKELGLDEVGEEREGEMAVEVRDDRFRQIVFRHSGRGGRLNTRQKNPTCLHRRALTNKGYITRLHTFDAINHIITLHTSGE